MGAPDGYCKVYRLKSTGGEGYECCSSKKAKAFLADVVLKDTIHLPESELQRRLLSMFRGKSVCQELIHQAQAGLSLRCFVSRSILFACKRKASLLHGGDFQLREALFQRLITVVLNDDGETLLLIGDANISTHTPNANSCLAVNSNGEEKKTKYKPISLEVLESFNPDLKDSQSLGNWTYTVVYRHRDFKKVLSEKGSSHLTNWAILNRENVAPLKQLSVRSCHINKAFHAVYRRDRRQSKACGRCLDPTDEQLNEMVNLLNEKKISVSPEALLKELENLAKQLRRIESPEMVPFFPTDPETGAQREHPDLPVVDPNRADLQEQSEMSSFLRENLIVALEQAIQLGIRDRLNELNSSRRQQHAHKYIPGLRLMYCEGLTQQEIATDKLAGFANKSQVAKVLEPMKLISQIRFRTLEKLLDMILVRAEKMGLTSLPPQENYLSSLVRHLEKYVDDKIFTDAISELRAGGANHALNSVYASYLCRYIQNH